MRNKIQQRCYYPSMATVLSRLPHESGNWHGGAGEIWRVFHDTVDSAFDYFDPMALTTEITLSFREDLLFRATETAVSGDGCLFYGFLFSLPGRIQAVTWMGDGGDRRKFCVRGNQTDIERVALELKLFGDACFRQVP